MEYDSFGNPKSGHFRSLDGTFNNGTGGMSHGAFGHSSTSEQKEAGVNHWDTEDSAYRKIVNYRYGFKGPSSTSPSGGSYSYPGGTGLFEAIGELIAWAFHCVVGILKTIWHSILFTLIYLPIHQKKKTAIFLGLASVAFMTSPTFVDHEFGKAHQWSLEPSDISFKESEYYGVDLHDLKRFRSLQPVSLYTLGTKKDFHKLSSKKKLAFYAAVKERLLVDKSFIEMDRIRKIFASQNVKNPLMDINAQMMNRTCGYAHAFFDETMKLNLTDEKRAQLTLEKGYFNFNKTCNANADHPAVSFLDDISPYKGNALVKPYYDTLSNDMGIKFIKASGIAFEVLFFVTLGWLVYLVILYRKYLDEKKVQS